MTPSHRQAIVLQWPEASDRTTTCRRWLRNLDPIGGPIERYQDCADQIQAELMKRIERWACDPPQKREWPCIAVGSDHRGNTIRESHRLRQAAGARRGRFRLVRGGAGRLSGHRPEGGHGSRPGTGRPGHSDLRNGDRVVHCRQQGPRGEGGALPRRSDGGNEPPPQQSQRPLSLGRPARRGHYPPDD